MNYIYWCINVHINVAATKIGANCNYFIQVACEFPHQGSMKSYNNL